MNRLINVLVGVVIGLVVAVLFPKTTYQIHKGVAGVGKQLKRIGKKKIEPKADVLIPEVLKNRNPEEDADIDSLLKTESK